ncbi:MAG: DapH/DapD/GlmU-related protein [Desulfovibrionaceae bacterium]|nr:DapH/DapD/GlmU-related protein [Desulfovibrionaceae bacterium]
MRADTAMDMMTDMEAEAGCCREEAVSALCRAMREGRVITAGTAEHRVLLACSNQAMRLTAELSGAYHSPDELRALMARITGRPVDKGFGLFPPFYTDFGRNIFLGRNVFINAGCCFQDQGGIYIGDNVLIGHRVVLATINHGLFPARRCENHPAPIHIENNVWIGAGAIVLPGVTIGENAIVAAGAVVAKDAAPGTLVAGVPARQIRKVDDMADRTPATSGCGPDARQLAACGRTA